MRLVALAVLAVACAAAQPGAFTLDQVLSAPFPSSLAASATGGKLAWVSNARGVRNIMVAEPPAYQARRITAYTADDGQELGEMRWTLDAAALVYVRGSEAGRYGDAPNPALDPKGAEQALWIVRLDGAAPRRIAEGDSPAISPKGDRVAFLRRGQIWLAPLDGNGAPALAFRTHGQCGEPLWSPDGARIAFVATRGDHSFIGVFDTAAASLKYLDPSTDRDIFPAWSPDGRSVAFIRVPSSGLRAVREARRSGEPWSVRVASVETGEGRQVWRASEGRGSVFQPVVGSQLLWAEGNRLVFPWEGDGWTHLYSVAAAGSAATLLTPGEFEVEDVALAAAGRDVVYSSNQRDIDRRHLWSVATAGGTPTALTSGTGIECKPAPVSAGVLAFLRADAQRPVHPALRTSEGIRDLEPLPPEFPLARMVTPQQVILPSADGLQIHGQLFLPAQRAARMPAIVFVHGGPRRQMLLGWHSMYYYANAYAMNQYLAASGYVVLSINFRSGIGYGMEFREALNFGASGGAEFADVQGAGIYLRSRSDVDPARIGIWGGSYGGYLTALALARASTMFRAGVDFHGVHDWAKELGVPAGEPDYKVAFEASPMAFVDTWRSPVLLIHGDDDPDVQFNQTVILKDALRSRKVAFEEMIIPEEVHDFLLWRSWRDAYTRAADFFGRKLNGR
jgi:dipeptidyl aminopeptidase/acylaminoacyl peptidase